MEASDDPGGHGFPGMASSSHQTCPFCGSEVELLLDPSGGLHQVYVEDCEVCCNPWAVSVRYEADGTADVSLRPS